MFKRVDRRLKRKAEQEELGIDSELKEALGIPDTDSDESDSSDDDEESDEDEGEDEGNVEEDEADVEKDIDVDDDEEALSDDGSEDDEYDRSVADVLANPLYPSATDPDKTRCSVCPGKTLSSPLKIGEHLKSKASVTTIYSMPLLNMYTASHPPLHSVLPKYKNMRRSGRDRHKIFASKTGRRYRTC